MRWFFSSFTISVCALLAGCGSGGPNLQSATTLTSSASYALVGSAPSITLTSAVTGAATAGSIPKVAPTGSVIFSAGTTTLGSASLSGASPVSITVSAAQFPLGQDSVHAVYSGDSNFVGSTSAAVAIQVQTTTTTTLAASPDSIQQGQAGYLIASVARSAGTGAVGGSVTFSQSGSPLGTATVDGSGTAALALSTAQLPLATYPVSANYAGDAGDLPSASAAASFTITPAIDVLTQRNNSARNGMQATETALTLANVNASTFGKVFSFATDGYVFAQPLYISNYLMSDGKLHNVLIVATAAGSVYAFDADNNNPAAGFLWHISVLAAGEQPVGSGDVVCNDTNPYTSIIGTPVVDRTRGIIYLVGRSKMASGNSTAFYQRIHALNVADGSEKLNGPTVITASVPGSGDGSVNGVVTFNALTQHQRAALVEASGSVWITWASHCDNPTYHGWTIGYNANDVSQQTGVYNNTPNGSDGGIWMTAGGISADNLGHLFTAAGNGTFDVNTSGSDYGDTVQRLDISATGIAPGDWFAPSDQAYLADNDLDFGTVTPLLFDDPGSITPHLLATADKPGNVYLLNRDALGSYDSGSHGPNSLNGDIQDFPTPGTLFNSFGYFNQRLYVGSGQSAFMAYNYNPGTATTAGFLDTTPSMSTTHVFGAIWSTGGMQPVFSANGTADAIVWGLDLSGNNGILFAFDANNLATELFNSTTNQSRDQAPAAVKFTHPVVANGRVYVGGQSQVAVYGLLP